MKLKKLLSRRVLLLGAVALLALFLVRPQVGRLRVKVSQSIAQALGRNVDVRSVHLRFFPRPGFELDDLVVRDNAGSEPLLRAPDVTAWLRVSSLMRGKLEIASLDLGEASLNLTRSADGTWNIQDLLEKTSRSETSPINSGMLRRPRFPYVEASKARINFKVGAEKTHFALTNADFSLWQDSESVWGMRLKAAPIRTDENLTDTGTLTLSGLWQRSAVLPQTPVQFSFSWKQAQIGQLSNLIYGDDKGWRGNVVISGTAIGTPDNLRISGDGSVDNFRRYDVLGGVDLKLEAHCSAGYNASARSLSDVDCISASGDGSIELKGSASGAPSSNFPFSTYDLRLVANKVPSQAALTVLRQIRAGIAGVKADGALNANFQISRKSAAEETVVTGGGSAQELRLISEGGDTTLPLGTVPFRFVSGEEEANRITRTARKLTHANQSLDPVASHLPEGSAGIEIGPVNLATAKGAPLQMRALLAGGGYWASIQGDTGLKRALQIARTIGLPAPAVVADGNLGIDVRAAGTWSGEKRPAISGSVQLRSVHAQVRGLNAPLTVTSANLSINEDSVRVQNLIASVAEASWRGSLLIPRPCPGYENCVVEFNVHTGELSATSVNRLLNPAMAANAWYKFLSFSTGQAPYLLRVRAQGKIAIDKMGLGRSSCSHFTSDVRLDAGQIVLSNVQGEFLGGTARGELRADFKARPPKFAGTGTFDAVSLADISEMMHDGWITGTGAAKYDFAASGTSIPDLLESADLNADFTISRGIFPHVVLAGDSESLRANSFTGALRLHEGEFSLIDGKLQSTSSVYKVNGTATLNGALDLKLAAEGSAGYSVTGTLLRTRVSAIPTAQAALKP